MLAQDVDKLKQSFGDREFTGGEVAKVLGLDVKRNAGALVNQLKGLRVAYKTATGWRFGTKPEEMPQSPPIATALAASELVCAPHSLVRIGELYLSERMLLIADTARQETSPALRIYTTIIEVDSATKHPRNKIVNFIKSRDPKEYAQAMAWLDSLAGVPPTPVDDTALELAAELEKKLNAATKENADLRAKLDAIRGAL